MAELTIDLILEDDRFKKALSDATKTAKKSGREIGEGITKPVSDSLVSVATLTKGFIAAKVAIESVRAISGAFSSSIAAANKQEDAINQLNAALKRTGEFTKTASEDFQNFASQIQSTSVFGDELIIEQLAYAKSLGLTTSQAKDAVLAAVNLSAALGKDLNSSLVQLLKTFSGLQGELGESLPSLRNLSAEALRAGGAVSLINTQFAGAGQSQLSTYSGGVKALGNAFGDFTESLGQYITQSSAVNSATQSVTSFFSTLALKLKPIKTSADQVKLLGIEIDDLTSKLKDNQAFLANSNGIDSQVIAVRNSVKEQESALAQLKSRLFIFKQEIEQNDIFGPLVESAKKVKVLTTQEIAALSDQIKLLGLSVSQQEEIRLSESIAKLKEAKEAQIITESEFFERRAQLEIDFEAKRSERLAPIRAAQAEFEESQRQALLNGQFQFEQFGEAATSVFKEIAESAKVTNKIVGQAIVNGIGSAVSQGFAAFGAALANGENALEAFGKAFLQQIGQQAVALGTKFILEGAAISFSPTSGGPAVGVPLIAKGAALATFGGAISAFAGGGAGGGGASGSNNPASSSFQPENDLRTNSVTDERLEPETRVSINIQGDVLDSDESSLRIVQLLQNADLNNNVKVFGGIA